MTLFVAPLAKSQLKFPLTWIAITLIEQCRVVNSGASLSFYYLTAILNIEYLYSLLSVFKIICFSRKS